MPPQVRGKIRSRILIAALVLNGQFNGSTTTYGQISQRSYVYRHFYLACDLCTWELRLELENIIHTTTLRVRIIFHLNS